MDKRLIILALVALLWSDPQITYSLGQTKFNPDEFRFLGNNFSVGYTFNGFSRLQFGIKYDYTSAQVSKTTSYSCSGLLATTKLVLNTFTGKSPYFGFNFGWLNSTLSNEVIIYNARGSFTGEAIAGYSFRLDDYNRLDLEYRNRYIELKLPDRELLRSQTYCLAWSIILAETPPPPVRHMDQKQGLNTKKEYLAERINYNKTQIKRYDELIAKYDQRILSEGGQDENSPLFKERAYLIQQKKELEQQNEQMWKILEE